MDTLALLLIAFAMPTAAGYGYIGARAVLRRIQAARPPLPESRPIERIWRDLRRLHAQLSDIENAPSDLPAKNARCRATRAAYLDALTAACVQLEIPQPAGRPVPDAEIYRAELELRRCGLDVRPVG